MQFYDILKEKRISFIGLVNNSPLFDNSFQSCKLSQLL